MRSIISILILLAIVLAAGCQPNDTPTPAKSANLAKPPELTMTIGDQSARAVLGTYSWSIKNRDGTVTHVEADSDAPPGLVRHQEVALTAAPQSSIALHFAVEPNAYSVHIWEGNDQIAQQISDGTLVAPQDEGFVVYEVYARWEQGTAHYAFAVNVE